jgi:hypothetical protein
MKQSREFIASRKGLVLAGYKKATVVFSHVIKSWFIKAAKVPLQTVCYFSLT